MDIEQHQEGYGLVNFASARSRKIKFIIFAIFGLALIGFAALFLFLIISNENNTQVLVNRLFIDNQNLIYLNKLKFCFGTDFNQTNCTTEDSIVSFTFLNKSSDEINLFVMVIPVNSTEEQTLENQINSLKEQNVSEFINILMSDVSMIQRKFILKLDSNFNVKDIYANGRADKHEEAFYFLIAQQFAPNLKANLFQKRDKIKFVKRMLGISDENVLEKEDIGSVEKTRNFVTNEKESEIEVSYEKTDISHLNDNGGLSFTDFSYKEKAKFGNEDGNLKSSVLNQKGNVNVEADIGFDTHSTLDLVAKDVSKEKNKPKIDDKEWNKIEKTKTATVDVDPTNNNERILQNSNYQIISSETVLTKTIQISSKTVFNNQISANIVATYNNVVLNSINPSCRLGTLYASEIAANGGSLNGKQISFVFQITRTNLENGETNSYNVYTWSQVMGSIDIHSINNLLGNVVDKAKIQAIASKFDLIQSKTKELLDILNRDWLNFDKNVVNVCVTYGAQFCFTLNVKIVLNTAFTINNFNDYKQRLTNWWNNLNVLQIASKQQWIDFLNTLIDYNFNLIAQVNPSFSISPEVGVYPPVKVAGILLRGTLYLPAQGSNFALNVVFNCKRLGLRLTFELHAAISIDLGAYIIVPSCMADAANMVISAVKDGIGKGGNIAKNIFNCLLKKTWDIAKSLWNNCRSVIKLDGGILSCGWKAIRGDFSCIKLSWGPSDPIPVYTWNKELFRYDNIWTLYDNGRLATLL